MWVCPFSIFTLDSSFKVHIDQQTTYLSSKINSCFPISRSEIILPYPSISFWKGNQPSERGSCLSPWLWKKTKKQVNRKHHPDQHLLILASSPAPAVPAYRCCPRWGPPCDCAKWVPKAPATNLSWETGGSVGRSGGLLCVSGSWWGEVQKRCF